MTCPECKKRFEPLGAKMMRIKKRPHIQCPNCLAWIGL